MFGRGVSVGVREGVAVADGLTVKVGVTITVGLAVWDGGMGVEVTCAVAGAQAPRTKRVIKINKDGFLIQLNANRELLTANS